MYRVLSSYNLFLLLLLYVVYPGIHSYTACVHCGFAMLDEEVLTRWCHGSAYEAHIKGEYVINRLDIARL